MGFSGNLNQKGGAVHTIERGEKNMKEDEKQPIPWEAVDPKPPVIRSGHLENRVRNDLR